jgi:hypothetical protein
MSAVSCSDASNPELGRGVSGEDEGGAARDVPDEDEDVVEDEPARGAQKLRRDAEEAGVRLRVVCPELLLGGVRLQVDVLDPVPVLAVLHDRRVFHQLSFALLRAVHASVICLIVVVVGYTHLTGVGQNVVDAAIEYEGIASRLAPVLASPPSLVDVAYDGLCAVPCLHKLVPCSVCRV